MDYDFNKIEKKWRNHWRNNQTYKTYDNITKPKYYVLDMFPYPSGAGLHVGHPLGYIASDIMARYKRANGFNVLHPMGYDSFGLPAEQYAIQFGQHPAITTENNIARYRDQLDILGFSFDWDREVRTSDPGYYKWTQWIFKQLYNSWYNLETNKAEAIDTLIKKFTENGSYNVNADVNENWYKLIDVTKFHFGNYFEGEFTATDWNSMQQEQKELILQHFRIAYLANTMVNWCEGLGTVLANDEIKEGLSERGGYPVVQKLMKQWSLRITSYAERLINDLETIDWPEPIKEMQCNWIGKSEGASVVFEIENHQHKIEVFTTRPDTIFGATFITLAPEHSLVKIITTAEQKKVVEAYIALSSLKTERDRQSDVKNISGAFTGAYCNHPFTREKIPIWIGDYVLASYGTGAVMAVPCGDQRDWNFAKHFGLEIKNIFENVDVSEKAYSEKEGTIANSGFISGHKIKEAIKKSIQEIEAKEIGKGKVNYRLRDAIFSRQRYWGEPFPVYFKNNIPYLIMDAKLPVELPPVDAYLPTATGEPPLARARKEDWKIFEGDKMETNTMPGWAGSSWYFLRYLDPINESVFADKSKIDYWQNVDLYIGGAEHATGHLLYARFWTKFLFDRGFIPFIEPFKKMINQGMILGRSNFVYRIKDSTTFVSYGLKSKYETTAINVDISIVENDVLDTKAFKNWRPEFEKADFILEDGKYNCGFEIEKMSKAKFNVQNPDELVEKFGADTLRMFEMFLGPLEQFKPWDTKSINGVHNFLRRLWRLFYNPKGEFSVQNIEPTKEEMKILHKTIKKITDDIERYSFNTVVSTLMICTNELTEIKCNNATVLKSVLILLAPYAPHIAEELWEKSGEKLSINDAAWPKFNEEYLVEDNFEYPVSFNGKTRYKISLPIDMQASEIETQILSNELTEKYLEGKQPKKIIVVPKRIVNVVY
jgi:leucyl-tRNA synthetase